jgi:dodecin
VAANRQIIFHNINGYGKNISCFYYIRFIFIKLLKKQKFMAVLKVIEILASSPKSWEDATAVGVAKASKTIKGIKSAYVQSQSVVIDEGNVTEYRVNLKLSFEVM